MTDIVPEPILARSTPSRSGRALQLILLSVASGSANYARSAVGPLQEAMRIALGLSDNRMALLQGPAIAFPLVLAALPLGLLIDRKPRARLLVLFAFLNLAGGISAAVASSFWWLFGVRCLTGLMASAISITTLSLLADLYPPPQRGRASMVVAIGEVAGASVAFALGGALLAMSGSGAAGWRWAMLWLAGPLGLSLTLMFAVSEPLRAGVANTGRSAREALAELWRYRAMILPLLTAKVMVVTAYGAALTWAAPTLSRRFGLAPDRIGGIMATALLVSGIAGPIVGGFVADFCQRIAGPRRTVLVLSGLALVSAPFGVFAIAPGVASVSALLVVFLTLVNVIGVTEMTLTTIVIPSELRGLCLSVLITAGLVVGLGLAPVTVSSLSAAIGGPARIGEALALVCVTTGVSGAAIFALGRRSFPRAAIA